MKKPNILFAGGSGVVGRAAIKWFRERFPDIPVLVGGRNMKTAGEIARQAGNAEAVAIDLDKPRLGLDEGLSVAAVAMLAPDIGLNGLTYAQDLGVPYLSIGDGLIEVGAEMALFAYRATAAPVVLASHWSAGAPLFLALDIAKNFESIHTIRIGFLLDEKDPAGKSSYEDMDRLHEASPAFLVFENGRRVWLAGDSAKGTINTIDGRSLDATAYSPFDIIGLFAATGAPNIRFDLVTAESSSRRRGGEAAAEVVVEIEGKADGLAKHSRSTLEFKHGQASLTGLSAVLSLSAVLGLNGCSPAQPGLYLPELLSEPKWFLDQLRDSGAVISSD